MLTGAGRAFCAGDDRKAHEHPAHEAEARELVDAIQRATRSMVLGEKPVIGAINGWAVGGGFEWALNCDLSIWARGARAFFPEVSLNLFVTGAVTAILPAIGLSERPPDLGLEVGVGGHIIHLHRIDLDVMPDRRRGHALPDAPQLRVAIGHALCEPEAVELESMLRKELPATTRTYITDLGTAIGVHGGPGTLVVAVQHYTPPRELLARLDSGA